MDKQEWDRTLEQEALWVNITEEFCSLMEAQGLSLQELSDRLDYPPQYVTKLLRGGYSITLETLSNLAYGLGYRCQVTFQPLKKEDDSNE